ncbi:helix-turn-helix domain-containing protein [Rhodococcus sp. GXMU-t2271]|uniref:helix-turn-helix domain-containing protein n=1 Tax=Rhodococcus sp. GXMU-t2271 TaxID=3059079 RepID=UPI00352B11B5
MQPPRPIEHYLHGDGHVVIVPARVAAWLERRADLNTLRINSRGLDPEIDAVLGALRISSLVWRNSVDGTTPTEPTEPTAPSPQWMSTSQVATHLGITDRAVRKAIARGALHAENIDGRWLIDRDELTDYRATRNTGRHHAI